MSYSLIFCVQQLDYVLLVLLAYFTNLPFLFPSLGPTTFLQFAIFEEAPASPRNTLVGHFIGIIFAYLGLLAFNLTDQPSVDISGVSMNRVGCTAFSIGFTCVLMIIFKVEHPPAAATTLIVAMGYLKTFTELTVLMAGVVVLTIFAFIMNRMLRNDGIYPIWRRIEKDYETIVTLRNENFASLTGILEPLARQDTETSIARLVEKQDSARSLYKQLTTQSRRRSLGYQSFPLLRK
eukprot:UN00832